MEQVVRQVSTYSGDWAGVCSALYELGGMIVIHDASGCNSTYTTFDEPRWYQMDSMFYISGLTEMDAIMGNDEKLLEDVITAARRLHPKFIALVGSPIPSMLGTDLNGLAAILEHQIKIPSFGFATNGMQYYCQGGALAFEKLAKRFCELNNNGENTDENMDEKEIKNKKDIKEIKEIKDIKDTKYSINIMGVTPLDFSVQGNVEAMKDSFEKMNFVIKSVWAMGSSLEEIKKATEADVNVVVSTLGIKAARYMWKQFNIPYVIGIPIGSKAELNMKQIIEKAASKKENQYQKSNRKRLKINTQENRKEESALIIGEAVISEGIRYCLTEDFSFEKIQIVCPLKTEALLQEEPCFLEDIQFISDESKIEEEIEKYAVVIADPMYRPLLKGGKKVKFIPLPHEAFSSRIYRKESPILIGEDFQKYMKKRLLE